MANSYGVFRSDNMKATKDGSIKSGRYYVGATATAIENGNIVKLDSLIPGERELWKVVAPGAVTAKNLYIVATPEIVYDETLKSNAALKEFRNEAGANLTLLQLQVGDVFSISDACITPIDDADDIPAVGNFVVPGATGTKWVEEDEIEANEVCYGKIIARETVAGVVLNVIEMQSIQ
jgi:hypothetical protein